MIADQFMQQINNLTPDTWFAFLAILTLWAYVAFAPGQRKSES
jgi:hypothetical protein